MFDFCAASAKHQELWPVWKVRLLAVVAWALRIQFKIDGYPYGGPMSKRARILTGDGGAMMIGGTGPSSSPSTESNNSSATRGV